MKKLLLFSLPLLALLSSCMGSKTIGSSGIRGISLGMPMPEAGLSRYKGQPVRDTFLEDGQYEWRAIRMQYPGGPVYVEEDFFKGNTINRIRIQNPKFKVSNGLHIGSTIQEMMAAASDWFITPLPGFQLFDMYSRTSPGVHYLVSEQGHDMSRNWETYTLAEFKPDTKVQMIVLQ